VTKSNRTAKEKSILYEKSVFSKLLEVLAVDVSDESPLLIR
jgi:hypothetical protein